MAGKKIAMPDHDVNTKQEHRSWSYRSTEKQDLFLDVCVCVLDTHNRHLPKAAARLDENNNITPVQMIIPEIWEHLYLTGTAGPSVVFFSWYVPGDCMIFGRSIGMTWASHATRRNRRSPRSSHGASWGIMAHGSTKKLWFCGVCIVITLER